VYGDQNPTRVILQGGRKLQNPSIYQVRRASTALMSHVGALFQGWLRWISVKIQSRPFSASRYLSFEIWRRMMS
jgi:hypothetical protein